MSDSQPQDEHPEIAQRNAVYGLVLFAVYVLLYGGFIYLAVFQRATLAAEAVSGVNVAIVYGFGLIVAALVLALVYMLACRR